MMINLNSRATVISEQKLHKCLEYIDALEEERRKIQVFQRELPLCLHLVTQEIEACKQQLITSGGNEYNFHGQSECSDQTSSEGPVLEEFIPIKRLFSSSDDDVDQQHKKISKGNNNHEIDTKNNVNKLSNNSDWLRTAQLWNQSPDPTPEEDSAKVVKVVEVKRDGSGGAFNIFKGDKSEGGGQGKGGGGGGGREVVAAAASSWAETGESSGGHSDKSKKHGKEGQSQRKQRRSWSSELHNKFLDVLQQLGGSHAATPKQIKELMNVDGLTNDEVKSHLQKYRLHTRTPNRSNNNRNTPGAPPQFVMVRGPPENNAISGEATTTQAITTASNVIYAPIYLYNSN